MFTRSCVTQLIEVKKLFFLKKFYDRMQFEGCGIRSALIGCNAILFNNYSVNLLPAKRVKNIYIALGDPSVSEM